MKLTKDKFWKALSTKRDLTSFYEECKFDDCSAVDSPASTDFFQLMCCTNEVRKHCLKTANKISNRFPLIRLAALYHDASFYLEGGKMRHKEARNDAGTNAWQLMRHFEFGQAQRKFVWALICVHNYNLLSTNVKRDPKRNQPLRQWRKALMDARSISKDVDWRDILRLVLADCDGKPAWWRKWLARPIVKYFTREELLGAIVYSRADLAITTDDIFRVCPEVDNRLLNEVYQHLLDHVAFNGYEYNDKAELVMETVSYIRGKQENKDILDSRVIFKERL